MDLKMSIQWHIINICNGNCSYCTYKKNRGIKKPIISFKNNLITALNHIYELNRPEYEFRFMGSGGEPTMHPFLGELLWKIEEKFENKLSKNGNWILTNGLKDVEYFKKIRTPNINYNFSIHPELIENDDVKLLIESLAKDSAVHINVMYLPTLRDKCKQLINLLISLHSVYKFTSRVVYVRDEPNFTELVKSYTEDDIKYVLDINKQLRIIHNDDNKYWELDDLCENTFCVQGANVLRINESGNYSGSSCMLAKYSDDSLFDYRLKNKISDCISVGKCTQKRCASDIHMSRGNKFYTVEDANNFVKNIKNEIKIY